MNTIDIKITRIVAGTDTLQYSFQLIGCPCLAAIEVPTTLALAPIGVALPPISVPIAKVHDRMDKSTPVVLANVLITGIIVAANGMLSTKAEAKADTHKMMATMIIIFPPLISPMKLATLIRIPVCSKPPTTINKPIKNNSVL